MKPSGALMIEVEPEPKSGKLMGEEETSDFDAAIEDAFDAFEKRDRAAFRDAMAAAVSAKCAEMYSEPDGDD